MVAFEEARDGALLWRPSTAIEKDEVLKMSTS